MKSIIYVCVCVCVCIHTYIYPPSWTCLLPSHPTTLDNHRTPSWAPSSIQQFLTSYLFWSEVKWKLLSLVWLFVTSWTIYSPWNSPGQNTGVGSLSLQGIFPTQGLNPSLPQRIWGQILYQLSHKGSPAIYFTYSLINYF